jgi:hypothetical protein
VSFKIFFLWAPSVCVAGKCVWPAGKAEALAHAHSEGPWALYQNEDFSRGKKIFFYQCTYLRLSLASWGGFFSPFMQMYVTWGPSTWALASVCPLYSVSFSSVYHNTDGLLLLVRRKLPLTHRFSLKIHVIGTERRAQVRPTCSIFKQLVHVMA